MTLPVLPRGYRGPIVLLTLAEAEAIQPTDPNTPLAISAAAKIQAALDSTPDWRKPLL